MSREGIRIARVTTATALWTAAVSLGVAGTAYLNIAVMFWAGMTALVACLLTGHLLIEDAVRADRVVLEDLLDGLIAKAAERAEDSDVRRIH